MLTIEEFTCQAFNHELFWWTFCRGFYIHVNVGEKEQNNVSIWKNSLYKKFPLSYGNMYVINLRKCKPKVPLWRLAVKRTEISLCGFAIVARAWILSLHVYDCLNGGAKRPGDRYQPITTTYYIGNSSCSFERKHTFF